MPTGVQIPASLFIQQAKLGSNVQRDLESALSRTVNGNNQNLGIQKQIGRIFQDNTKSVRGFTDQVDIAFRRLTAWTAVATVLFQAQRAVVGLGQAVIDLSRDTTSLRVVLPAITTDFAALNQDILKISNRIAVPFKEARQAFVEIARAGFGSKDSFKLLEVASIARAVGEFDNIKEAFLGLLPIIEQFNVKIDDTGKILDKVSALAVGFATTESDLIDVVKRAGAAFAEQSDGQADALDKLLALATAAKQTTQLPASLIGTSLRSIATRLGSEKVLTKLEKDFGIQARGFGGEITPAFDVLEQIAGNFNKLTDAQRQSIAATVGERRNIQVLINILSNWQEVTKALATEQAAAGSATQRLTQHTDSLRGSIERAKNSFGGFAEELRKGGLETTFKNATDALTGFVNVLSNPIISQLLLGGGLAAVGFGIGKATKFGLGRTKDLFTQKPEDFIETQRKSQRALQAVQSDINTRNLLGRAGLASSTSDIQKRFLIGSNLNKKPVANLATQNINAELNQVRSADAQKAVIKDKFQGLFQNEKLLNEQFSIINQGQNTLKTISESKSFSSIVKGQQNVRKQKATLALLNKQLIGFQSDLQNLGQGFPDVPTVFFKKQTKLKDLIDAQKVAIKSQIQFINKTIEEFNLIPNSQLEARKKARNSINNAKLQLSSLQGERQTVLTDIKSLQDKQISEFIPQDIIDKSQKNIHSIILQKRTEAESLRVNKGVFNIQENIAQRIAGGQIDPQKQFGKIRADITKELIKTQPQGIQQLLGASNRLQTFGRPLTTGEITLQKESRLLLNKQSEELAARTIVTAGLIAEDNERKSLIKQQKNLNRATGAAIAATIIGSEISRGGQAVGGRAGKAISLSGEVIGGAGFGALVGGQIGGLPGAAVGATVFGAIPLIKDLFEVISDNTTAGQIRNMSKANQSLAESQKLLAQSTEDLLAIGKNQDLKGFQKFARSQEILKPLFDTFSKQSEDFTVKNPLTSNVLETLRTKGLEGDTTAVKAITNELNDIFEHQILDNVLKQSQLAAKRIKEESTLLKTLRTTSGGEFGQGVLGEIDDKDIKGIQDKISKELGLGGISNQFVIALQHRAKFLKDVDKAFDELVAVIPKESRELIFGNITEENAKKQAAILAGLEEKASTPLDTLNKDVERFVNRLTASSKQLASGLDLQTKLFEDSVKRFEQLNGTARIGDLFNDFSQRFGNQVNLRRLPIDEIVGKQRSNIVEKKGGIDVQGNLFEDFIGKDLVKAIGLDKADTIIKDTFKGQSILKSILEDPDIFDFKDITNKGNNKIPELFGGLNDIVRSAIQQFITSAQGDRDKLEAAIDNVGTLFELDPIKKSLDALTEQAKARQKQVETVASAIEKVLDPLQKSLTDLGKFAGAGSFKDVFKLNRGLAFGQSVFGGLANRTTTEIQNDPRALQALGQRLTSLPHIIRENIFESLQRFGDVPVTRSGITGNQASNLLGQSLFPQQAAFLNQMKEALFGRLGIGPDDIKLLGPQLAIEKEQLIVLKQIAENTGGIGGNATGGVIGGGGKKKRSSTDTVFAMLTPGEEIVTKNDPRHINNLRGFAQGGVVSRTEILRKRREEFERLKAERLLNAPQSVIDRFNRESNQRASIRERNVRITDEAIKNRGHARSFEDVADFGRSGSRGDPTAGSLTVLGPTKRTNTLGTLRAKNLENLDTSNDLDLLDPKTRSIVERSRFIVGKNGRTEIGENIRKLRDITQPKRSPQGIFPAGPQTPNDFESQFDKERQRIQDLTGGTRFKPDLGKGAVVPDIIRPPAQNENAFFTNKELAPKLIDKALEQRIQQERSKILNKTFPAQDESAFFKQGILATDSKGNIIGTNTFKSQTDVIKEAKERRQIELGIKKGIIPQVPNVPDRRTIEEKVRAGDLIPRVPNVPDRRNLEEKIRAGEPRPTIIQGPPKSVSPFAPQARDAQGNLIPFDLKAPIRPKQFDLFRDGIKSKRSDDKPVFDILRQGIPSKNTVDRPASPFAPAPRDEKGNVLPQVSPKEIKDFLDDLRREHDRLIKELRETEIKANISLEPVQGNVSVDVQNDPQAVKALAQIGFIKAALEQFVKNNPIGGSVATAMAGALAALDSIGKSTGKGEE